MCILTLWCAWSYLTVALALSPSQIVCLPLVWSAWLTLTAALPLSAWACASFHLLTCLIHADCCVGTFYLSICMFSHLLTSLFLPNHCFVCPLPSLHVFLFLKCLIHADHQLQELPSFTGPHIGLLKHLGNPSPSFTYARDADLICRKTRAVKDGSILMNKTKLILPALQPVCFPTSSHACFMLSIALQLLSLSLCVFPHFDMLDSC